MSGQLFYVFCLALLVSFVAGTPIGAEKSNQSNTDVIQALESYVQWTELVSNQFAEDDITKEKMIDFEKQGKQVHEALFAALNDSQTSWNKDDLSKSVLELIEYEWMETDGDSKKVVGLVFADSIEGSQGARLAVASRIFGQLSIRLRATLHEAKKNLSSEILVTIITEVGAAEIAFDTLVESFELIDKINQVAENEDTSALSRPKRQASRRHTNWNRGRTTVGLTPHFGRGFRFNGATGGFNHRFRNGHGSVFGSASIDHRGRFTGGSFGIRLSF